MSPIDAIAAVDTGVELAIVNLDDGKVGGVLTGFGGGNHGRSPDELTRDTLLLCPPLSDSLVAQGPRIPSAYPSTSANPAPPCAP